MLLVLAFPDFGLWPLAWIALAPLLAVVARRPRAPQAFLLGWTTGTLFFYASTHWLTYPMIHYAGLPAWVAYPLLLPGALVVGLFPALAMFVVARACARWGARALFVAAPAWVAAEWARLGATGQLWNAIGYSQAYVPELIQGASIGGVYLVGFLIVTVNAALAYLALRRDARSAALAFASIGGVALLIYAFDSAREPFEDERPGVVVVALQPNVIPNFKRKAAEHLALTDRHFESSERALMALDEGGAAAFASETFFGGSAFDARAGASAETANLHGLPRVVVWPESPMNFSFARNARFRERVARFTEDSRASLLFNALEPDGKDGGYNAAVLVNEEGRLAVQYDKIRLLPFGEYVPLPSWIPGAKYVRGVVGDFTPGTRFTLMPLGNGADAPRAGVFICIESAYPYIARTFARDGADVLINLTNDAYQGDTAVMRQHLANAVYRAVETGRPLLRVTNTGITARITSRGEVQDATLKFQTAIRVWTVARSDGRKTFYVEHGDMFVAACSVASLMALALTFGRARRVR